MTLLKWIPGPGPARRPHPRAARLFAWPSVSAQRSLLRFRGVLASYDLNIFRRKYRSPQSKFLGGFVETSTDLFVRSNTVGVKSLFSEIIPTRETAQLGRCALEASTCAVRP